MLWGSCFCFQDEIWFGAKFRASAAFTPNNVFNLFQIQTGATAPLCYTRFNIDGTLGRLYYPLDSGVTYVSTLDTAFTLVDDTEYTIEIHLKLATGAGNNDGSLEFRVGGTTYHSMTGLDNDTFTIGRLILGNNQAGVPANGDTIKMDGIIVSDSDWPYSGSAGSVIAQAFYYMN